MGFYAAGLDFLRGCRDFTTPTRAPYDPRSRQDAAAPEVATLTPSEIARVLAWQHRLLNFTATPLGEVVAALNRRNATQLVLADPGLAALRVSASLRSDNIHGFVNLLETGFDVRAEHRGDAEILLRGPP